VESGVIYHTDPISSCGSSSDLCSDVAWFESGPWLQILCHVFSVSPKPTICAVDNIEKNEIGGACSTYCEGRDVYRVLVGET
jgi:hypothetical protein